MLSFDTGIGAAPAEFNTTVDTIVDTAKFPESEPLDLQLAPVSLESKSLAVASNGDIACANLLVESVSFTPDDADLETLLTEAEYDRSRAGEIVDIHFAPDSLNAVTFSGVLPVAYGGTGTAEPPPNSVEGSLVLGSGTDPLRAAPVAFDGVYLDLPAGGIMLGSNVVFAFNEDGVPEITLVDSDVHISLADLHLESLPKMSELWVELNASNDEAATVAWETTHEYMDGDTVFFKLWRQEDYVSSTAYEMILSVTAALEARGESNPAEGMHLVDMIDMVSAPELAVSLTPGTQNETGGVVITGMDQRSDYRLVAATISAKGSVSALRAADFTTTEYYDTFLASVDAAIAEPTAITFGASNAVNYISELTIIAGLLSSYNEVFDADFLLFADSVKSATGGNYAFLENVVAPGTASNWAWGFTKSYNIITGAFEPISERSTYYPFVFLADTRDNVTLCNLAEVYNPDISPPVIFNFREDLTGRTFDKILLRWDGIIDTTYPVIVNFREDTNGTVPDKILLRWDTVA